MRFLLLNIALLSSLFCFAQNSAKIHVQKLCDTSFFGRGYVDSGDYLAANYIKGQFEEFGLNPVASETYFQYFSLGVNTINDCEISIQKKQLVAGVDYLISTISGSGSLSSKPVFLDSNEFKAKGFLKALSKLKPSDILMYRTPKELKNELPTFLIDGQHQKLFSCGAIVELTTEKFTWSVGRKYSSIPCLKLKDSLFDKNAEVSIRIEQQFKAKYQSQNVVGEIKGSKYPNEYIVYCAHYDHLGKMGRNAVFRGANDNASGTAMLLDLASFYSKPENKPEKSILFIAFAAEEAGLVGSKYFVNNSPIPLASIKFLMNLDLVGFGEKGITVVNGKELKEEFELLTAISDKNNLFTSIAARGAAPNSDHYPFWDKGVPCFFIYGRGGNTAYHDVHDVPENLTYEMYPNLFQLLVEFMGSF